MAKYLPLLEQFVVKETKDVLAFRKLSESETAGMSKELVESLYKATEQKAMGLEYGDVSDSKGDITKIRDYQTLVDSIGLLNSMQANLRENIEDLDAVNNALKNLINNKENFEQGFRVGNTGVELLYNNIAMALVASTSFIIATSIDYVKDPVGNYSSHFRNNVARQKGFPTIMIDSLKKFNKLAINGDLAKFFQISFSKKALVGLTSGATLMIGIGVALVIVPLTRELVYQFFHMRVKFAEYLRLQSEFLEMNRSKLGVTRGMSQVSKKQEKVSKEFQRLADKIDVDMKSSTKKAEMEIKKENNTISMNSPSLPSNDSPYDSLI